MQSKRSLCLAALLLTVACAVSAQTNAPVFEPSIGQEGKDVIWVPTPPALVERMLKLAQVKPNDYVVDLGAGDGRIAIAAAKSFRARALGIEYNPEMVAFANRAAEQAGVSGRAGIVHGDIFEKDFSQATVVTMYLLTALNLRLRPKLLDMKPGTRLVAHQFGMGDWAPDETSYVEGRPAHLWIVPAKAAGTWTAQMTGKGKPQTFVLQIEQRFQKITGNATFGKLSTTLRNARLQGEAIRFSFTNPDGQLSEFAGRLREDSMSGEIRGPGPWQHWKAAKGG